MTALTRFMRMRSPPTPSGKTELCRVAAMFPDWKVADMPAQMKNRPQKMLVTVSLFKAGTF